MKLYKKYTPILESLFALEKRAQGIKRMCIRIVRYFGHLFSEFIQDEGLVRASGLAYVSLLGIVPLLAVGFSFFTSFGAFAGFQDQLRQFLLKHLIPSSTDQVIDYLEKFIANTRALRLISVVSLLVVAVFIFNSIESAFNRIWKVRKQRSIIIKFIVFSVILVWGPVLIGASIYVGGKIKAFFMTATRLEEEIDIASRLLLVFLPVLLNTIALFIAYLVVPNTKVRILPALVGGTITGILWEIAKSGFNVYVANMITYKTLYGSLSLIPFFLVWLYVTWLIVLFGAEITFTLQNLDSLMTERILRQPMASRTRLLISLKILKDAIHTLDLGETLNLSRLSRALKLPNSILKDMVNPLVDLGLLRYADEDEITPAITPDKVPLSDAIISVHSGISEASYEPPDSHELEKILIEIESSIKDRFSSISLAEWARGDK